MRSPLGTAIVGAGQIGRLRAAAAARTPGLDLRIAADVRPEAAEEIARRQRCQFTRDWQTAVADPSVDLVIISTPPDQHASVALAAIAGRKHVLCEKPLAHTLEDGERICREAEARGVLVKTGFNHRYFPAVAFAQRIIAQGRIGEVKMLRAYAGHQGGEEFGHPWVHDAAVTGGGCLIDNGIHLLDLTRFLLGEVARAKGYVESATWKFGGVEDNGFALFRTESGAIASVHASWTEWRGYRFWIEAVGTRGFVRAFYPPMFCEWGEVAVSGHRARRRFKLFPAFQILERLRGWQWTVVRSFMQELSELADGIRGGRQIQATGRDGLRALQMAHAVYRSAREGIEVIV